MKSKNRVIDVTANTPEEILAAMIALEACSKGSQKDEAGEKLAAYISETNPKPVELAVARESARKLITEWFSEKK